MSGAASEAADEGPPDDKAADLGAGGPASDETPADDPAPKRGLLIVQLDGVAAEVLRLALRRGPMPILQRLLDGSHRLAEWSAGPPSQTSSSQAAILYGDDFDIPAFRWYEKERGRLMVSNHPADAALIDARARHLGGLLAAGGSSIANLVSGGAPHSTLTIGTLGTPGTSITLSRWLLDPRFVVRELFAMIGEVLREVGQSTRQRMKRVRPRVRRGGSFPFLRAISNVLLRDLTSRIVVSNLRAGIPTIYATYVGYDVVAHHAGPTRPDSIKVLARLDRELGVLLDAADGSPRTYDVVVLSDHGQSTGTPFRHRFHSTLEDVVGQLATGSSVSSAGGTTETWGHLNEVLSAAVQGDRPASRRARRALRPRLRDGYVELGPDRLAARPTPADIVVCASGNLAHIYLSNVPGRVPLESIREFHPGLVEGLIDHPGIEFVLGQTVAGPIVLGRRGSRSLTDGTVEGIDPLAAFGPSVADALRRLDAYPHSGDLIVNGRVNTRTGDVAAFEDLVGSHGGLGGDQTHAFVIAPAGLGRPGRAAERQRSARDARGPHAGPLTKPRLPPRRRGSRRSAYPVRDDLSMEDAMGDRVALLVGTRKGGFIVEGDRGDSTWEIRGPVCEGWPIHDMSWDPTTRSIYAAGGSPWYGPAIWRSDDLGATWTHSSEGLTYGDDGPKMPTVWNVAPVAGAIYAGVEPAGLFRSTDGGATWSHVSALRDHPSRPEWQPGNGGLILHSIVVDPANPARLWVGISSVGVFQSEDGGATWTTRNAGTRAGFMPEPDQYPEFGQCVHKLVHAAGASNALYQQNHCGVYRTSDGGAHWEEITAGLPGEFGFPMVAHPRDPNRAFTIPLNGADQGRFMPDASAAVWRTSDRGASWERLSKGLPQEDAWLTVLREAMAIDLLSPAGVYFGTEQGALYGSADEGESWQVVADDLPTIWSVDVVSLS